MNYIDLDSVVSTITNEGMVFPIYISEAPETASEAEEMMGVHLTECDDEWWNNMSVEDSNNLMGFLTPLFFDGVDFGIPNFIDWGMDRLQYVINMNYIYENNLTSGVS